MIMMTIKITYDLGNEECMQTVVLPRDAKIRKMSFKEESDTQVRPETYPAGYTGSFAASIDLDNELIYCTADFKFLEKTPATQRKIMECLERYYGDMGGPVLFDLAVADLKGNGTGGHFYHENTILPVDLALPAHKARKMVEEFRIHNFEIVMHAGGGH
jgi:hypothetical protein